MISETFKRQPKWRRWGTVIILVLSLLFIIISFLIPSPFFLKGQVELSPQLSLLVLALIFYPILDSKLGAWGVVVGIVYSIFADLLLPDCYGYRECGLRWLFPPFKTMWMIIPSLFFGLIGFVIEFWYKSSEKKTIHLS